MKTYKRRMILSRVELGMIKRALEAYKVPCSAWPPVDEYQSLLNKIDDQLAREDGWQPSDYKAWRQR